MQLAVPNPFNNADQRIADPKLRLLDYFRMLGSLFSRRDKRRYLLMLCLLMFGAGLDFVGIGLIPAFIGLLASPEKASEIPVVGEWLPDDLGEPGSPVFLIGAGSLVFVFVFKSAYFAWMYNVQFGLLARHRTNMGRRIFSAYMKAPWTFHLQHNSAELMRKVVVETGEICNGVLLPSLGAILGSMMTCLLVVLIVLALPWQCVMAFICLGMICAFLMSKSKKILTRAGQEGKLQGRRCIQTVNEGLATVVDARILGREPFLIERFSASMSRFAQADRIRVYVNASFTYLLEAVVVIGIVFVLWLLVRTGKSFAEVLPQVALIGAVAMRLRQTTAKVFSGLGQIHFSKLVIQHIVEDILDLEGNGGILENSEIQSEEWMTFENELRFEEILFTYPDTEKPAVGKLNLTIKNGESVAFVGSTGSGKSTAINLLLGLLNPDSGRISVDGSSIHPRPGRWQRRIGYVPQTIHLLDDTVRTNIAFGVPDEEIDEKRLAEVIELAQLKSTIAGLEDGLDTVVGERGMRISGGQRQRLGIARALYHCPSVLVMDEGTAALDAATEASLVCCLRALEGQVTMIFVAHRLSTIEHCDKIFFLKNGELLGAGRHNELLETLPAYREMHRIGEADLAPMPATIE